MVWNSFLLCTVFRINDTKLFFVYRILSERILDLDFSTTCFLWNVLLHNLEGYRDDLFDLMLVQYDFVLSHRRGYQGSTLAYSTSSFRNLVLDKEKEVWVDFLSRENLSQRMLCSLN
jgi:hypothetical protein